MEESSHCSTMTNQEVVQLQDEVCKGNFEWKIEEFMQIETRIESPNFKFGRNEVCLYIPEVNKSAGSYYGMYIVNMYHAIVRGIRSFSSKTLHRLSLVDRYGRECLTLKGTTFKNPNLALCFNKFYLIDHCDSLLPDGALTIRLSWFPGDENVKQVEKSTPVGTPEKLLVTLSKDLYAFYESKTDTDCLLRVGDAQFPVHRAVLSARSSVFAAMFRHDTLENRSGVVDIPDMDASVLNDILRYVYSGQVHGMTADTAAPMYVVADKYVMDDLKEACRDFLMHNLTIGNICEVANLAQTYEETELEDKIALFIDDNYEELEENDEWKLFTHTKPLHANKLLRSAYFACRRSRFVNKKMKI